MITQCPKCQKMQDVPEPYRGKEVKCLGCKGAFSAVEYREPEEPREVILAPEPDVMPAGRERPLLSFLMIFFAWVTVIVSIACIGVTDGYSLCGLSAAIFMGWAAEVLDYLDMIAKR
jgi:hypothetical protein